MKRLLILPLLCFAVNAKANAAATEGKPKLSFLGTVRNPLFPSIRYGFNPGGETDLEGIASLNWRVGKRYGVAIDYARVTGVGAELYKRAATNTVHLARRGWFASRSLGLRGSIHYDFDHLFLPTGDTLNVSGGFFLDAGGSLQITRVYDEHVLIAPRIPWPYKSKEHTVTRFSPEASVGFEVDLIAGLGGWTLVRQYFGPRRFNDAEHPARIVWIGASYHFPEK